MYYEGSSGITTAVVPFLLERWGRELWPQKSEKKILTKEEEIKNFENAGLEAEEFYDFVELANETAEFGDKNWAKKIY